MLSAIVGDGLPYFWRQAYGLVNRVRVGSAEWRQLTLMTLNKIWRMRLKAVLWGMLASQGVAFLIRIWMGGSTRLGCIQQGVDSFGRFLLWNTVHELEQYFE